MIPKVIHYCWFGRNPLPSMAIKCIESWKKYFPDYKIIEWNENNFDININSYTKEAYQEKKYAFVSDYARLWIIYNYGGVYFDTDVEVINPMNDIIEKGPFMGCETSIHSRLGLLVNPGLGCAAPKDDPFFKKLLDSYRNQHFYKEYPETIVDRTTTLLKKNGLRTVNEIQLVDSIYVYPSDYFCPIDYYTHKKNFTHNTRTIHHFAETWLSYPEKMKMRLIRLLGERNSKILLAIKKKIFK